MRIGLSAAACLCLGLATGAWLASRTYRSRLELQKQQAERRRTVLASRLLHRCDVAHAALAETRAELEQTKSILQKDILAATGLCDLVVFEAMGFRPESIQAQAFNLQMGYENDQETKRPAVKVPMLGTADCSRHSVPPSNVAVPPLGSLVEFKSMGPALRRA